MATRVDFISMSQAQVTKQFLYGSNLRDATTVRERWTDEYMNNVWYPTPKSMPP